MVPRIRFCLVAGSGLALLTGCLSLSLGGKHEIVTATDVDLQNRVSSLEARVLSLEQRLGGGMEPTPVPAPSTAPPAIRSTSPPYSD